MAWRELLLGVLPAAPGRVADLGCGTGTLSVLPSDEGRWANDAGSRLPRPWPWSEPGWHAELTRLDDAAHWGRVTEDERYLLVSAR